MKKMIHRRKKISTGLFFLMLIFLVLRSNAQVSYCPTVPPTTAGNCASQINYQTQATGIYSFATGYKSIASAQTATAFGYQASALGSKSVAIGENSLAQQEQGYAFGISCKANATQSMAIGQFMETNASGAIALGSSISGYSMINGIPNSLMIGFNSTVPTFFICRPVDYNYNGIGRVGVGTTSPQTLLHVNGDVTISPLINTTGRLMLTTDATGKLMLTDKIGGGVGDNMGNHIATQDVILGNNMLVGSAQKELRYGPTGEPWQEGLKFRENTSGEMTMNSFTNSSFTLSTLLGDKSDPLFGNSFYWASNTKSGGYGFGLRNDLTGGIYYDKHEPSLVIGFKGKKVGIGTNDPLTDFQVNGSVSIGYNAALPSEAKSLIVSGNIGIGTFTPSAKLDVAGKVRVQALQLTTGFNTGYVMVSDYQGNASWVDPTTVNAGAWIRNGNTIFVSSDKKIGIGTGTPAEQLQIIGNILLSGAIKGGHTDWQPLALYGGTNDSDGSVILMGNNSTGSDGSIKMFARGTNSSIEFSNKNMVIMALRANNDVVMGNPNTKVNMLVNGDITASLVRVNTQSWWDCVFHDDYNLQPLAEVEAYINRYKHLPEIPTEAEVKANGVDVAQMNALLLKKVEELTLYVIELEKRVKDLDKNKD
jgi:hypothetical protein